MTDQPSTGHRTAPGDGQAQGQDLGPSTGNGGSPPGNGGSPTRNGGSLPRETLVKAIAALVIVLILAGALAASLIGSSVNSKPRNVPFGVVGSSALVTAVGKQVSLKPIRYANASAVHRAIDQTKIYGALIPGAKDTLIVVPAASFALQLELGAAFRDAAAKTHTPLVVQQSHPLPPADPVGAVAELILLPLLIGGYLASVLLTKATGIALGPRRMATLVGYAFVGALLTDLIVGPLLGAYANSHFWILWPIFALITAAVAVAAAAIMRLLGVWGTLVVFFFFIILGGSSNGGSGIPLLPPFWHAIGPYLPAQNAVVVVRNTLYFDGNGTTHAFVVLGLYLLVGVAFGSFFKRRRPQKSPGGAAAPTTAAATGSGHARVSPVVGALLVVAIMQCLFALNYTTADRNPVASNLPFGVVGASSLVTQVQKHMSLKTIQYPSQAAVHKAFDQAKIYGALVPGSKADTLIINEAASEYAPIPLAANFATAAKQLKTPLKVQASNKPPSGDPGGVIPSLVLIVLLVAGYVGSTALMSVTGTATGPRRVAGLVVFAFVAALLLDLISGVFAWGWPIHQFWPLWPIMALVILTAALVASVLEKLFGAFGTFLTIMVMILFGNPSTGGAVGAPFLPSFWRHLGPFLPARNGLTAVHSTMYFNGHGMTQAIVILGVYAVVFGALSQFLGSYRTPQLPLDVAPETQMQSTGMSIAGTAIA